MADTGTRLIVYPPQMQAVRLLACGWSLGRRSQRFEKVLPRWSRSRGERMQISTGGHDDPSLVLRFIRD
jgi:hypothetical protein